MTDVVENYLQLKLIESQQIYLITFSIGSVVRVKSMETWERSHFFDRNWYRQFIYMFVRNMYEYTYLYSI